MISRAEIDQSHSILALRMTEGDPLGFAWWIFDAQAWASASFTCIIKKEPDPGLPVLASLTVTVVQAFGPTPDTEDQIGLNVDLTAAPVATLVAADSPYSWALKEIGGVTRYGGLLYVEPSPI